MRLPCPHCEHSGGGWSFERTYSESETVTYHRRETLALSGSTLEAEEDEGHADPSYGNLESHGDEELTYSCCGNPVYVDDFENVVIYGRRYADTLDYVRDAFQDNI